MLFHSLPFPGALFPSVINPQKALDGLARVASPHILLFHEKRGLVLFSSTIRDLWPGADLERSLEDFRLFTEDGIVPAETHHLSTFWENLPKERGECADMFVIKAGRYRKVVMLGFVFFRFSWGGLMIVVPSENPRELGGRIASSRNWANPSLVDTVSAWVEDSDREALTGTFLGAMPEEFRKMAIVERHAAPPSDPDDSRPGYRLTYRVRGGEWQRDASLEETPPPGAAKDVRIKGKVVNGEVAISFSVYVGGLGSLGSLSFPVEKVPEGELTWLNRFLHDTSEALCERARQTVLPEFSYCRHWGRGGFRLEAFREMIREGTVGDDRSVPVLPLWFPADRDPLPLIKALDQARYTSDLLFVDEGLHSGCLLLRNVSMEKAAFVRNKLLREKTIVAIDPPVTLGEYLDTL